MSDLTEAIAADAEQRAYVATISKRVGELVAAKVDTEGFLNASDDDLRNMAATLLLLIMDEVGDEALENAVQTAVALGFSKPKAEDLDLARERALKANAEPLYSALEEQRARARKSATRNAGNIAAGLAAGITAALTRAFSEATQGLATDLPVELNAVMAENHGAAWGETGSEAPAEGEAEGGDQTETTDSGEGVAATGGAAAAASDAADAAAADDTSILAGLVALGGLLGGGGSASLTWITLMDDNVCDEEDVPPVVTPSGRTLPAGAATSCAARHGITLPANDWASEGYPRDQRLLCSRFQKPRCRCLLSATANVPVEPVKIGPATEKGKARGQAEQLDLTDAHLQGLSVSATGEKAAPDLWKLSIRVSKRPALVPVGVGE